MAKLKTYKPNILERLKSKHSPKSKSYPKDKGEYAGSCNRRACLKPNAAYWYNHSTCKYYCEQCAIWLNTEPSNKKDAYRMFGHNLCTVGEYDAVKYQKIHDLHRTANL